MTARQKATAQLQALLAYRASGKGDRSIDALINQLQARWGLVKTETVTVNKPALNVRPLYRKLRSDKTPIPAGVRSW